jgi:hypothetical protein
MGKVSHTPNVAGSNPDLVIGCPDGGFRVFFSLSSGKYHQDSTKFVNG